LGDGLLGGEGLLGGQVGGDGIEGADLLVEVLRAAEIIIGDGDRRQFLRADRRGQLDRGELVNLGHGGDARPLAPQDVRRVIGTNDLL